MRDSPSPWLKADTTLYFQDGSVAGATARDVSLHLEVPSPDDRWRCFRRFLGRSRAPDGSLREDTLVLCAALADVRAADEPRAR